MNLWLYLKHARGEEKEGHHIPSFVPSTFLGKYSVQTISAMETWKSFKNILKIFQKIWNDAHPSASVYVLCARVKTETCFLEIHTKMMHFLACVSWNMSFLWFFLDWVCISISTIKVHIWMHYGCSSFQIFLNFFIFSIGVSCFHQKKW